ncbi:ABC transporter permease [bacterium]|nr:ABC transporter permease [bacterium]
MSRSHTEADRGPGAGPRIHPLSVLSVGFACVFVLFVVTLLVADLLFTDLGSFREALGTPAILAAMKLSLITSGASLLLVVLFAVPVGYALSRYRFPCHVVVETLVDLPIVLPPLVIGVSLLVFFNTPVGRFIEGLGLRFVYTVPGIILCQFLVSASYGIRAASAAFGSVDRRLEQVALTLGCTQGGAFRRVSLPLARSGIVAGAIMAWARAVGVFGPLMIFAGSVRFKTEVMPTTIFLELSIGRIEVALAVALVMTLMATIALIAIHALAPGKRWWGA